MDGPEATDQVNQENQIPDRKEKNQEKTRTLLPKIADLPEKAQKRAFKKLEEAQQINKKTEGLLEQVEQDIDVYKSKEPEFYLVADSCEKITPEQQAEQDKKIQAVRHEFEILKSSFEKLSHGQDAPELMEFAPDKKSKISRSLQRLRMKFYPKAREANQLTQQKNISLLYQRTTILLKKLEEGVEDYSPETNKLNKLLEALALEDDGKLLDETLEKYSEIARKNSAFSVPAAYYLEQLHQLLGTQADYFKEILIFSKGEEPEYAIVNQAVHKIGDQERWVKEAITRLKEKVESEPKKLLLKKIDKYLSEFSQLAGPIFLNPEVFYGRLDISNIHRGLDQAGQVREILDIKKLLRMRQKRFKQIAEELKGVFQGSKDILSEENQDEIPQIEQELEQATEQLARGQDLLLHGVNYAQMKKILRGALLASRKSQIEVHGESLYNSAGIEVGKDYVKVDGKKMTIEEYESKYKQYTKKSSNAEMNQICFSENRPYERESYVPKHSQGIMLVFSKARLFASSQFTEWDGWHLFNQDFNDEDKDPPGFSIDLTNEPFVLLATEDIRDDLENFVKTELAVLPEWKAIIANPDKWIKEHIFYLPQKLNYEDQTYEKTILPKIQEKLFVQFKESETVGQVLPTGNQGDCINSKCDLFTYKITV